MNEIEQKKDPLDGKVSYLLIATIAVQFLYPLSVGDSPLILIAFQIFYISLFSAGIYLVSNNRLQMQLLIGATIVWLILGAVFAIFPDSEWLIYVSYGIYTILIGFMSVLTSVLLRYIFRSKVVTLDVLLASCTVYLLLGGIFATLFNIIEITTWFNLNQHAFVDGLNAYENQPIPWQVIVYYSYATLSTLGYGDVLPVTLWARSMATLEAVIGVLYTAVIVARLVGLYAAGEVEEEIRGDIRSELIE